MERGFYTETNYFRNTLQQTAKYSSECSSKSIEGHRGKNHRTSSEISHRGIRSRDYLTDLDKHIYIGTSLDFSVL